MCCTDEQCPGYGGRLSTPPLQQLECPVLGQVCHCYHPRPYYVVLCLFCFQPFSHTWGLCQAKCALCQLEAIRDTRDWLPMPRTKRTGAFVIRANTAPPPKA